MAAFVLIAGVVGLLARFVLHFPLWAGFLLGAVTLLVNGLVATIEDELPGGFNGRREKDD